MLLEWIALLNTPKIPIALKRELITKFGSPQAVLSSTTESLEQSRILSREAISQIQNTNWRQAEAAQAGLSEIDAGFVSFKDKLFPPLLNEIPSPPLGLFYKGKLELIQTIQLAIVGSRNGSPNGLRTASAFAKSLGLLGFTITSGMASGIDSAAHESALANGIGTIAVMGTGIDLIYPKTNKNLYDQMSDQGLILSEYLPGTSARRQHFPQRNRIISGLSLGTLVVEAGIRSGSLITARLSAEQGREVFAIPGSIHMPTSRGCHKLIRDGAKLVESTDDIIEELNFSMARSNGSSDQFGSDDSGCDNLLYKLIDFTPTPLDVLIQRSGMDAETVMDALLTMELEGVIGQTQSGYVKLATM